MNMVDVVISGRPTAVLRDLAENLHPERVLQKTFRDAAAGGEERAALRLCGIDRDAEHAELTALAVRAEEVEADLFVVPAGFSVRRFRVACFDMDSTLTQNECIDDMAAKVGKGEEVARITREAMEGKLPFSENLTRRVGILKGFPRMLMNEVDDAIRLQPGAEAWIGFLQRHGVRCAIVTGGFSESASVIAGRLGIDVWISNTLEWDDEGRLTGRVYGPAGGKILDADGKRRALEVFAMVNRATLRETIAAGDGANDLQMIGAAGFGFAYHGKPVVVASAPHAVRFGGLDRAMLAFVEAWETV